MAKVTIVQFDRNERIKIVGELLDTVSNLKSKKEIFEFLFRLLTASEVLMLARRFQIAKMLLKDSTYDEIREKLHVSPRTISDGEKWLHETDERADFVRKRISKPRIAKTRKATGSMLDAYAFHHMLSELFE